MVYAIFRNKYVRQGATFLCYNSLFHVFVLYYAKIVKDILLGLLHSFEVEDPSFKKKKLGAVANVSTEDALRPVGLFLVVLQYSQGSNKVVTFNFLFVCQYLSLFRNGKLYLFTFYESFITV